MSTSAQAGHGTGGDAGGEVKRPAYETECDRKNEREVADAMQIAWGCTFVRLKHFSPVDFAIERGGGVVAMAEVKCRTQNWVQLSNMTGLAISLAKVTTMAIQKAATGLPHYLIVRASDEIRYVEIDRDLIRKHPKKVFGTTKRGDPQNIEPCLFIPVAEFRGLPDDRAAKGASRIP